MPVVNPLFDIIDDEEVISVCVVAAPMTEGSANVAEQSVLYSVLSGQDIAANLLASSLDIFAGDVEKYFKYGRDYYIDGLPLVGMNLEQAQEVEYDAMVAALEVERGIVGNPIYEIIDLEFAKLPYYNLAASAGEYITENSKFDSTTAIVDIEGNPFHPDTYTFWHVDLGVTRDDTGLQVWFSYSITGNSSDYQWSEPAIYVLPDKYAGIADDGTKEFYQAIYYVLRDSDQYPVPIETSNAFYFTYLVGSGEYPDLDSVSTLVPDAGAYPVAAIRVNNVDYADPANAGTPRYDTTKKLLDTIGVDIQQVYTGVIENPDQAEVDHVYVHLGCNPNDTREEAAAYMWHFSDYYLNVINTIPNYNEGKWQIGFNSDTFQVEIEFDDVLKETLVESTHGVGKYWMEVLGNDLHVFKQTAASEAVRYILVDLQQNVNIYSAKYTWHTIGLTPNPSDGQIIVIPLQRDIVYRLPRLVRNEMLYTSLYTVFHAYKIEYIEWYEDGFLGLIIAIVGIFIPGYSGWNDFIAGLGTAAASGIVSLGIYVGQLILTSIAISVAAIIVTSALGLEGAIAMAVAMWATKGSWFSNLMPDGGNVMWISGPAMGWGIDIVMDAKLEDFSIEMASVKADIDKAQAEAEAMWESLQPKFFLDPLGLFTVVDMPSFESPANYIGRKTATTSLNQMCGYDSIVNYVDNQLALYPV